MKIDELVKVVKKYDLFLKDKRFSDAIEYIEYLFLDYPIKDDSIPINNLIDDALTWGYENDDLKVFYSENYDYLTQISDDSLFVECSISVIDYGLSTHIRRNPMLNTAAVTDSNG